MAPRLNRVKRQSPQLVLERPWFPPHHAFVSSAGSIRQTAYLSAAGPSSCRPVYLEQSARQCDFSAHSADLPPATVCSLSPSLTLYWNWTNRPYLTDSGS